MLGGVMGTPARARVGWPLIATARVTTVGGSTAPRVIGTLTHRRHETFRCMRMIRSLLIQTSWVAYRLQLAPVTAMRQNQTPRHGHRRPCSLAAPRIATSRAWEVRGEVTSWRP